MHPFDSGISRRRLLAATAAFIGAPVLAQAAPVKIRYQLDWRFGASVVPYIVALKKGYFLQEGVDVSLNVGAGSAGTVTRIASGNFDMGTGDVNALAEFAANNKDIPAKAVMLIYEHTASTVFALKKSGIRSPADLKGRQLASPVSDTGRRLFPLFASANGLDPEKDVTWLSVEPALRETLLVRGRTDAITANMASGMVALTKFGVARDDMVVMRYSDFGVPLYGNAILANPGFIRDNPRAVTGFLRGYLRGLKDAHLDRRGGIAMLKQFEPLVDEQFEASGLDIILDQEIASAPVKKNGVGDIDVVKFQKGIDMLSRVVAFNTRPDPTSLIDMRWLPSRAERMIF